MTVVFIFSTAAIATVLGYIYALVETWEKDFYRSNSSSSRRLNRSDSRCPSHGNPPLVSHGKGGALRRLSSRSISMHSLSSTTHSLLSSEELDAGSSEQHVTEAEYLDMDHIYLSFPLFLLAYTFFGGINLFFSTIIKLSSLTLTLKVFLQRSYSRTKPYDAQTVAAMLVLETSISIYYKNKKDDIALFSIEMVPIINQQGILCFQTLDVEIDVQKKSLVRASLNANIISCNDAITVLFFFLVSTIHPKIHSYSNWATNIEQWQNIYKNVFPMRNGLVSIMYNYYGYTGFVRSIPIFHRLGLFSKKFTAETMKKVFDTSMINPIPEHSNVRDLMPHSRLVHFICKLRPHFMQKFNRVKHESFPGCHGEALFAQSVLHSLDHQFAEWIINDPLWFDVENSEFALMAQCNRVVRAAFVDDLFGVLFTKKFKHSNHPFYKSIYGIAKEIDEELADSMDTCIIK